MSNRTLIKKRLTAAAGICLISSLILPSTAHAYVDPGSGSVIVTTILGLIAAVGYTFRKYFYKLRRMFSGTEDQSDEQ